LRLVGKDEDALQFVTDRPGHDRRYALDCARAHALGWQPAVNFTDGLRRTVEWYTQRRDWWEPIKSGEYASYYQRQYANR
jgi:dTDP-glucose 4,6-dehydratase